MNSSCGREFVNSPRRLHTLLTLCAALLATACASKAPTSQPPGQSVALQAEPLMTAVASPVAASTKPYFPDYSKRDFEVVDYQFYRLPELPDIGFRGPPIPPEALAAGNYFSVIGGSQSVGVYVEKPYPRLLAERIGLPALNLGLGGAGPDYYASEQVLLEYINRGRFLILQVMTARSSGNSRLQPHSVELVRDAQTGAVEATPVAWARLMKEDRANLPRYVKESVESWRASHRRLLEKVKVPVIVFYFSHKPDGEAMNYTTDEVYEFFGSFPQFVAIDDVKGVAQLAACYAECRSNRNKGHRLISRFTGKPTGVDYGTMHPSMPREIHTHNDYYPSAEMHQDAADALEAALRGKQCIDAALLKPE